MEADSIKPLAYQCPACGFRIFNRRYPKCESCGGSLPESLVYTPSERTAILEAESRESATRYEQANRATDHAALVEIGAGLVAYAIASAVTGS